MNFLCKLFKFGTIFFYAVFFQPTDLYSLSIQNEELGLPYVKYITPPSSPEILNFNSIVQDSKGFLYIGGNNGVLQYDGNSWQQINIPGPVSVMLDSRGKIIARGKDFFGFIDPLPDGSLQFTSHFTANPQNDSVTGNIINIFPHQGFYLVHTSNGIFFLDHYSLIKLDVPGVPDCIVPLHDTLLMHIPGYGLFSCFNSTVSQIKYGEQLSNLHVLDMIPFNNKLLIYAEKERFLIFHNGNIQKINPIVNGFFSRHGYSDGFYHNNGQVILATNEGHLVFFDPVIERTTFYYFSEGLPGEKINKLFQTQTGNLWLLHDQQLTLMEWPSGLTLFDYRNGISGMVRSIIRFDEKIYAATSNGFYVLEKENEFKKIINSGNNCSQLLPCGKILLGISGNGLVKIDDATASLIYPEHVNVIYHSALNPDIVLIGTNKGLISLNISSHRYSFSRIAVNFALPVRDMTESVDGYLWISTDKPGLFRFSLADGFTPDMICSEYDTTDGLPVHYTAIDFLNVNDQLIVSTGNHFYRYDPNLDKLLPYPAFQIPSRKSEKNKINPLPRTINLLSPDKGGNSWFKVFDHNSDSEELWKANFYSTDSFEFVPVNIEFVKDHSVYSIFSEPDGIVWMGSQNQVIRFNPEIQKIIPSDLSVHIYVVDINNDHLFVPGTDISYSDTIRSGEIRKIRFSQNNIRFGFISTAFNNAGKGLYQYQLDGYVDDWSEWSSQGFCAFHDLSPGNYTFRVRSQDVYGNISAEDQFTFRISPPAYFSWWAYLIYTLIILSLIYLLRKWKIVTDLQKRYKLEEIIQERTEALIKEKEKSENLLANILPKNIEDELKSTGKATSSKFKMVTVLFADIQGFTKIAEQMNPEKLIDELDRFYFQFDSVVEKFNIEKIKTIGDAYMAAGGIPIKNRTNPVEVVLAALQMQKYMKDLKKTKTDIWDLRIGIHTGSVIAGVVGQKKFSYDIWGDTVNTASRMESSGEIGKVNVSATTYELVKDFFQARYRGKMPVKYKGDIEMYFITGIKPEFRAYDEVSPNDDFKTKLQLLRLLDLEEFIIQKLEKELPHTLYFHTSNHSSNVYHQVELLGRAENVTLNELLLLRSAALFHDAGYIDTIDNHETRSAELAREILPLYRYAENQIDDICKLILATSMPPNPKNLLEKIICDANLDHLGRVDFLIQSDRLFQEYRTLGKFKSKKEWNEYQIEFLKKHDFFTKSAQKMREISKEQQIENIIQFS